jgi:dUTP pyrophosphatase
MKIVLSKGAQMPLSAHDTDAGYDLFSRETKTIPPHGSVVFDTGVHIELPTVKIGGETFLTAGILKSKSGLNVKHNITSTGTIDVGYTGSIKVKLYNHGDEPYTVMSGDKITQLVIYPIIKPKLELVESLDETERGANGFGSTGR